MLDHPDNDIYIHIDKKCGSLPVLTAEYSKVCIIPTRLDVRWGDFSLVECEMELFKYSFTHGQYEYYHLLSGIDMPIKTQQYIQSFFTKNNGKEFVGFYTLDENWIDRVCKYHFFTKFFRYEGRFKIVIDSLRDLTEKIANNLSHRNKDMDIFKKGCNWCSISNKFCAYLISKEGEIKRRFHHTFCADEVFIQTIL